jgi:hypothetical protein
MQRRSIEISTNTDYCLVALFVLIPPPQPEDQLFAKLNEKYSIETKDPGTQDGHSDTASSTGGSTTPNVLYNNELLSQMFERWSKLDKVRRCSKCTNG